MSRLKRDFRFDNSWLLDEKCDEIVTTAWQNSRLSNFLERISLYGKELQQWSGAYYQNFPKKKEWLRARMDALRQKCCTEACRDFKDVEKQLQLLLTQ